MRTGSKPVPPVYDSKSRSASLHSLRNLPSLRRFPQRIPILAFELDVGGCHSSLDTLNLVRPKDRQRLRRMRENPGVSELLQCRAAVAWGHLSGGQLDALRGF